MTDRNDRITRLLVVQEVSEFLYREAELLDERRYDEWLGLLADDIRYWMPMRRNVKFGEGEREFTREGQDIAWFDEGKETLVRRVRQIQTGIFHQSLMIDWHERRRLATRFYIRLAEIANHGHTGQVGECLAIEKLYSAALYTIFRSLVQDRLAMDAQNVEITEVQVIARQKITGRSKVTLHDRPPGLIEYGWLCFAARPVQGRPDRGFQ